MKMLLLSLVLFGVMNCSSFWRRRSRRVSITPRDSKSRDVTVDVENDVKYKILRLAVTIDSSDMVGNIDLLVFKNKTMEVREQIKFSRNSRPTAYEHVIVAYNISNQTVMRAMMDNQYYFHKYWTVVESKNKKNKYRYQSNHYPSYNGSRKHTIRIQRSYGQDIGRYGKLDIKSAVVDYKKGLGISYDYSLERQYDIKLDYNSATVIRFGILTVLFFISLYLV